MGGERLKLLLNGDKFKIYGLLVNGACEADEYLKGLPEKEKSKLFPLLKYTADTGPVKNEQSSKASATASLNSRVFSRDCFVFSTKAESLS